MDWPQIERSQDPSSTDSVKEVDQATKNRVDSTRGRSHMQDLYIRVHQAWYRISNSRAGGEMMNSANS